MRRGLRAAAVVATIAVAAVAAGALLRGVDGAAGVPTYRVERERFVRRVVAEGNLVAAEATQLTPPPGTRGPMRIAWMVEDGSPVRAGDVVIRFDPTDMESDLREGRLERDTAASRIEQRVRRDAGDTANLARDADIAALQLDHAREFQSTDEEIFSRVEIIESGLDERLAERRREHADAVREIRADLSRVEVDLLEIEKRKAEMKIGQAEDLLDRLEVRAPHDGIFALKEVWGRTPEIGQVVYGGNTLAELPRLGQMEAEVFVLEADAGGLEPGLPAAVRLESDPATVHRGTVGHVDALARPRFRHVPVQYFRVVVALDETVPAVMKPGARVRAELVLGEYDDVLTVPRQAVFEEDGRTVAWVRRGEAFEPVEIDLGDASPGRVIVTAGLSPGDRVALHDPRGGGAGDGGIEDAGAPLPESGG